jgi:hypothetical protein
MGHYCDVSAVSARENVLVELKVLADDEPSLDEESLLHLARLLTVSKNSDLNTIPFRCVTRHVMPESQRSYAFLFSFPAKAAERPPVSLHDLINTMSPLHQSLGLSYRFQIAHSISKSLAAFHADNWVHKSFRSSSIAMFFSYNGNLNVKTPYLTSLEYSRATTSLTSPTHDDDFEKNLYRYLDRQRPPSISFNRLHDLWALGVVLLEIGLWETASSMHDKGVIEKSLQTPIDPHALKEIYLVRIAQDLAHHMGPAYAQAVKCCLIGDFGCSASDAKLSLAVHDQVIQKLGFENLSLSLLEEDPELSMAGIFDIYKTKISFLDS